MADKSGTPTILLGDLNEWRLGDRSSLHTFQSIFGPQPAAVPSFPARLPVLALDRIMSNRKGVVSAVERPRHAACASRRIICQSKLSSPSTRHKAWQGSQPPDLPELPGRQEFGHVDLSSQRAIAS